MHGRVASGDDRRRVAIPRRTTRGPLDHDEVVDDPLANSSPSLPAPSSTTSPRDPSPQPPQQQLQQQQQAAARGTGIQDVPSKDFSFLQDPAAYHVLPATNVAQPFLTAPNTPSVSSPLDTLLLSGHYRLAAIAAARNIVNAASATDYETLLRLVHVRLACLCLINEHAVAAQESKVLGDLNSAFYLHPLTNAHLVPWELRLLVVRLSALGYGEWRKGIMGYYELARECRENIIKERSDEEKTLWRSRLRECGIRVANVLIEMGDLEGAGRHLETLTAHTDPNSTTEDPADVEALFMETLVRLRVGDIQAARHCLTRATASSESSDEAMSGTLEALLHFSDSDYAEATAAFTALHESHPADPMITTNLAVCLLYTGRIQEARQLLSDLAAESPAFHALVFNLCTVYELCTERNRELKLGLAESLAARKDGGGTGWEVGAAEFKL